MGRPAGAGAALWRNTLCALGLLFSDAVAVQAQDAANVRLSIVDGDRQITVVETAFPRHLRVRVTDASGIPFGQARVAFQIYDCWPLLGVGCYDAGSAGHFAGADQIALSFTDAAGVATAPALYAGDRPGWVTAGAFAIPNEAPYFFGVSDAIEHQVAFQLVQAPARPLATVPLLGFAGLAVIAGLFVFCAFIAPGKPRSARSRRRR